ncbi:alpha-E domain-containing protein [Pelomonas sp. Root1217]|uniref:alpha-E domain-containing protein n=1 Tax=Pelomonas sp. Root1217 TaxID=1736430 RepID=UPI0009EB359A
MLSRTADHLFWLSRYIERAARARSARGEAKTRRSASARAVFSANQGESKHAV